MKCHDGEDCKHGCTDERMLCATPMPIVDELRSELPLGPARRSAIAGHIERLEQIALYREQDQRELAAWKQALHERSKDDIHAWETVQKIERRAAAILAANA